jgi:hypothetical protein
VAFAHAHSGVDLTGRGFRLSAVGALAKYTGKAFGYMSIFKFCRYAAIGIVQIKNFE